MNSTFVEIGSDFNNPLQATCFLEKKISTKVVLADQLSKYRTLHNNYTTANEFLKNFKNFTVMY